MVQALARNWWALVLRGVAGVLFGLSAFVWPGVTLLVLVALFGAYSLVDGIFNVVAAIRGADTDRWWVLLISGLLGILIGVWTFVWPVPRSSLHRHQNPRACNLPTFFGSPTRFCRYCCSLRRTKLRHSSSAIRTTSIGIG